MQIFDFEQRTPEWYNIRLGKLTASNAGTIATGGKGLETLCLELIADFYSDYQKEVYTNEHLERGNELEDVAKCVYELQTGNIVQNVGFVLIDDYSGVSPDGVIYKKDKIIKSIEIKCPSDKVYMNVLLNNYIDPSYYAQMQMQMYGLQTNEVDYVVYNPHFKKDLIINTIKRDEEFIKKLEAGLEKGKSILKKYHDIMKKVNQ